MLIRRFLLTIALALLLNTPALAETFWYPLNSLDAVPWNYILLVLRIDKYISGFNDYDYCSPEFKQRVEQEGKVPIEEMRREARTTGLYRWGARQC